MNSVILDKIINSQKNLIIEGDVLSGKTSKVLFPIVDDMVSKKESLLIIDSKEEYLKRYYEKFQNNGYNVVIINFRDLNKSEGWNPLDYPYKLYKSGNADRAQDYVEKIAKSIFFDKNDSDPYWSNATSDLFTGFTLGLFEDGMADEVNLNSVNAMFADSSERFGASDLGEQYFTRRNSRSRPNIIASSVICTPKETKMSIMSVAKQKMKVFASRELLSRLLSKTTFSYDDIIKKPTAIILITRDDNKTLSFLASMFIEQLYGLLLDKEHSKFNFILDNFDNIYNCYELSDILNSCVSRNVRTFIETRSLESLVKVYGAYIPVVCDLVSLNIPKSKLIINHQEEDFILDDEKVEYIEGNVQYPTLMNNESRVFDFKNYVKNIIMKSIDEGIKELPNATSERIDINDLIHKIENKIREIEEEEIMSQTSELEQFKMYD